MLIDGINLRESSKIVNLTVDSGTSFPLSPNIGELFYKITDNNLYVYNGTNWVLPNASLDTDLIAIATLSSNGIIIRTGDGTAAIRTIMGTTGNVSVINGDGISGNPTLDLITTGVSAGTYKSVTVDVYGRVIAGTNPGTGIFDSGSAAFPSITFSGDTDTGIYRAGGNIISITTGGIQKLWIDGNGGVTTLSNAGSNLALFNSTASSVNARVRLNSTSPASTVSYALSYSDETINKQVACYLHNNGSWYFQTGQTAGSEPTSGNTAIVLGTNGQIGVGGSANYGTAGQAILSNGAGSAPTWGTIVTLTGSEALTNKTYNGLTVTPSTGTLTITNGKTLSINNTITLAGTDGSTITLPSISGEVALKHLQQNSQSAAYTTVLADSGKHILHPSTDTSARTFTIDSNANVPYPIGTSITFVNQNGAGVVTIAITSDTMRLAGTGTTGSRTLAANGIATALKLAPTEWIIYGTGLT